jgi:putative transposase
VPALLYVDNGGGYANAVQRDEITGMAARIGYTITHSLPYNSQARGVSERSHQSIWVRAAKELPTFMGDAMDPEAKQKVFKLTRKAVKEAVSSPLLMGWPQFLDFLARHADAYMQRPHRGLPRMRDPESPPPFSLPPNP